MNCRLGSERDWVTGVAHVLRESIEVVRIEGALALKMHMARFSAPKYAWSGQVQPFPDDVLARRFEYLRVTMRGLRGKLEDNPGHPALLLNDPGIGYRLVLE